MSGTPHRSPSNGNLSAVRPEEEEPEFDPKAVSAILRHLGAKVEVSAVELGKLSEEMGQQTILLRGVRHDLGVTSGQVDTMLREQRAIKSLLTEVLARLPDRE